MAASQRLAPSIATESRKRRRATPAKESIEDQPQGKRPRLSSGADQAPAARALEMISEGQEDDS
ncbi:hypothetical protein C8Q79DRAFT_970748 [Trametes meyenii]|nr:hypothetical protein C8Q79DRAFT_970748 [Trametes meyenii]